MEWKERDQGLIERVSFLGGLADAFKEGNHADVQIKAKDGPAKLAHGVVLVSASPLFSQFLFSNFFLLEFLLLTALSSDIVFLVYIFQLAGADCFSCIYFSYSW